MQSEEMIGQVLGHYKILSSLGYGGMATVFLAEDIHLQRQIAIKLFQAQEGEKEEFLRRFAREARVLARLDHPNILPIYDYGEQNEQAYLVIPYMAGGSLRDFLQQHRIVGTQQSIHLISQILQGLQYAHEHGLIHRDIKPGNMLFKADGTLVLSDFGLVKVMSGPESLASFAALQDSISVTAHTITGTPDYMAPEQIMGQATQSSDIYAVGVVLYEMLAGSRPFTADNYLGLLMKHLHEQPQPLRERNPSISPEIEAVVMRTLGKESSKRYPHARDLQQALQLAQGMAEGKQPTISSSWPSLQSNQTQQSLTSQQEAQLFSEHGYTEGLTNPPQSQEHATIPVTLPTFTNNRVSQEIGPVEQQINQQYRAQRIDPPSAEQAKKRTPPLVLFLTIILVLIVSLGGIFYATGVLSPSHPIASPTVSGTIISTANLTTKVSKTGTPGGVLPLTSNTACPTSGSARAVNMPQVQIGTRANIFYIVNEYAGNQPTFGTIKRRDTSVTTKGIEILKMPKVSINEAQISQDGQWVLFVAAIGNQSQLRLVRIDGQGLLTLYCAPDGVGIYGSQLSYDQKHVVFTSEGGTPTTYLLDLTTGAIQSELIGTATFGYMARTWLDNQHIYMVGIVPNSDAPSQDIYILDISKGSHQNGNQLQKITTGLHTCDSFDSSYNNTQLLISTCTGKNALPLQANGPSSITSQPASGGGATHTLYSSPTHAITIVRAVSQNVLLLLIENTVGDKSQNGLWKINTDGTGLIRLTTDTSGTQNLCSFSQYSWSNISPDGTLYALESYDPTTQRYGMGYGSLNGNNFTQFADISDGTQLYLIGWAYI